MTISPINSNPTDPKPVLEGNRLKDAQSPYLIQHAHHPVDWYPWGEEAFEKARREDKPILVSIGYSTCHWCHVMAEESFSDPKIAEKMNRHFVCIKVDREERPDIDKVFITAVTLLTRSAGWPLNVFLSPDLKPFFGGTYFPPQNRPPMMGWPELLDRVADAWKNPEARKNLDNMARRLHLAVDERLNWRAEGKNPRPEIMDRAMADISKTYDSRFGGFSSAPKFPSPGILSFLFHYIHFLPDAPGRRDAKEKAREMIKNSLVNMCKGGICDHVGGGFHRYATDEKWFVPHFEKMLYDNAQMIMALADAWRMENLPVFRERALATIDFVLREMTAPQGGFYSALDADSLDPGNGTPAESGHSHGSEGAFYLWTQEELQALLKEDAALFSHHFQVRPKGNVDVDPFGEFSGKNILHEIQFPEDTARDLGKNPSRVREILERCRTLLREKREGRPRPFLDDKVICAWNGLMISALARAFRVFKDKRFLDAGKKAADFVLTRMYDEKTQTLYRIWRKDQRSILATAEDYAFLLRALLDLFEADHDPGWLKKGVELADLLVQKFHDPKGGGFFDTEQGPQGSLMRTKEDADAVIPSAGSVAAYALARLYAYVPSMRSFMDIARATADAVLTRLEKHPSAATEMLAARMALSNPPAHVLLSGDRNLPETREMADVLNEPEAWYATRVLVGDEQARQELARFDPTIKSIHLESGKTWARVCRGFKCEIPVQGVENLKNKLGKG